MRPTNPVSVSVERRRAERTRWLRPGAVLAPLAVFVLLVVMAPGAHSQTPELSFEIHRYTLDNGLRVVVSPDDTAPTVGLAVYYDVGSRNEVPGRSGFAHLFEHMMFQGSENVGKGEHFQHINRNGGRMNGTTSEDRTNYYEVLPSDRLALGLWLESDRMRSLAITEENFENQREVVKEERRLRVDNQPYVPAYLAYFDLAYESWEYGHSVIGSMDDLDAAELSDVQAFFDLYYAPNNAVLAIVGDVQPEAAVALVEQYFGDIPRGDDPPPVTIEEPAQTEAKEEMVVDRLATQPAVIQGWPVPSIHHEDHYPLLVAEQVLGGGESSRLYDRLVRNEQVAIEVNARLDGRRGPDIMTVTAITRGIEPEVVQELVDDEASRLATVGITEEELATAKEQLFRSTVTGMETHLRRSLSLARAELYFGDANRVNEEIDRIDAVTLEQVNAALARYLVPSNSTVMLVDVPSEEEESSE